MKGIWRENKKYTLTKLRVYLYESQGKIRAAAHAILMRGAIITAYRTPLA